MGKPSGGKRKRGDEAQPQLGDSSLRNLASELGVRYGRGASEPAYVSRDEDSHPAHKRDKLTIGRAALQSTGQAESAPSLEDIMHSLGAHAVSSRLAPHPVELLALRYGRDFYLYRAHILHTRQWFEAVQEVAGYPSSAARGQSCLVKGFRYSGRTSGQPLERTVILAQLEEHPANAGALANEYRFFSEQIGQTMPQRINPSSFEVPILLVQSAPDSRRFTNFWDGTHQLRRALFDTPLSLGKVSCVPYVRFIPHRATSEGPQDSILE